MADRKDDESSEAEAIHDSEVYLDVEVVKPKPWGFWATIGWTLLAGVLYVAVTVVAFVPFLLVRLSNSPGANVEQVATGLEEDGLFLAISTLITAVVCCGYLTLITRIRGWRVREYLALDRLRLRPTMVCLGILVAFVIVSDGTTYLLGRDIVPEFMTTIYETAQWPPLLIFALVVGAPVGEELMFRGFMYRGLAESIGVVAAVLVTSLAWAIIHIQYDIYGIGTIFLGGIMLGTVRHLTGSTTLTIFLHGSMNVIATVEVVLYIRLFE